MFKFPKNDANYYWTNHVMGKMVFYGLSPDRVKRVIRSPSRSEKGIAPETIAVMQPAGKGQGHYEVWVMYAKPKVQKKLNIVTSRKIIITAWRYPGTSPVREAVPIPANIIEELKAEGIIK